MMTPLELQHLSLLSRYAMAAAAGAPEGDLEILDCAIHDVSRLVASLDDGWPCAYDLALAALVLRG